MSELSAIKAILEGNIKDMQIKNVEDKRGETNMPKAPENNGTPQEFKKAPGFDDIKKAGNAGPSATPPHKDSKAKSSSSASNRLKGPADGGVAAEEIEDEVENVDVPADEDVATEEKESFADRMKKLRNMKKGGKKDDDAEDSSSDDSDDEDDNDDSDEDDSKQKKNKKDMDEHFDALFGSEVGLNEDFKNRAKTVFEAALADRENQIREEVEAELQNVLAEEVENVRAELAEQLDGYLDYVVEQWMQENRLQIENGVRTEIAESMLEGLRGLFLQHNITVPESKIDLVEELSTKVSELEDRLNQEMAANVELSEMVEDYRKHEIIAELGEGLATTQFERFATLCENVEFADDADFTNKAKTIKESYFGIKTTKKPQSTSNNKSTTLTENANIDDEPDGSVENTEEQSQSGSIMEQYAQTISRLGKK